jgi:phytoene synthase
MCALYAMARRIDDIGDGNAEPHEKLRMLAEVRKSLADLRADRSTAGSDPVLVALADTADHYPLPMGALDELIEGCEMDVNGIRYETFDDLVGYCRRVAGTVGRLSLAVYGTRPPTDPEKASTLADTLGVALQITNILRDIMEDLESMGRVYLPAEDCERFGVPADLKAREGDLAALVRFEAQRARDWYAEGLKLLPMLDWRSRACTAAMAGIYRRLLDRIESDPGQVLKGRISLSVAEKARVAARALARGTA